ncbi:hypothetical protein BT67DRAFT_95112 [Trichocladium antarcticum]|uniref:Uncharacterized protein n=1 Tax=Trichocladium antarcticum TaxID=1450529 RepID=A0AAN6ZG33_9PEZI|nr:hypothetical protein BT67DRAFT_95112 [Trichocladium antarcticum]
MSPPVLRKANKITIKTCAQRQREGLEPKVSNLGGEFYVPRVLSSAQVGGLTGYIYDHKTTHGAASSQKTKNPPRMPPCSGQELSAPVHTSLSSLPGLLPKNSQNKTKLHPSPSTPINVPAPGDEPSRRDSAADPVLAHPADGAQALPLACRYRPTQRTTAHVAVACGTREGTHLERLAGGQPL